ncbi:MAG TPA: phytoene/squalene synthase family protein [Streptosporangiaceae bacterium]|nr:phytoene/squalene synthase family protein [Streptosporangiaceae bacterium]
MTHPAPQPASLEEAYAVCCGLHRTHGRSYYLATKLLPAWKRRHVHALYGFTRYTDDIVDAGGDSGGPVRAARLGRWADQFYAAIEGTQVPAAPVLHAVRHTIAAFGLSRADFDAFFASMRMDLHVRAYADYAALLEYMEGSAAVIGTMMLPILLAPDDGPGPVAAAADRARESARQLGLAFQLTNFIRDVAEDLDRGRVYLPVADLESFGVSRADLAAPSASPAVRRLIAFEVERARDHYRRAQPGLALLPARSRRCVRLAYAIYGGILDRVEEAGCDVLAGRAVVPRRRRATAVVRELARPT